MQIFQNFYLLKEQDFFVKWILLSVLIPLVFTLTYMGMVFFTVYSLPDSQQSMSFGIYFFGIVVGVSLGIYLRKMIHHVQYVHISLVLHDVNHKLERVGVQFECSPYNRTWSRHPTVDVFICITPTTGETNA